MVKNPASVEFQAENKVGEAGSAGNATARRRRRKVGRPRAMTEARIARARRMLAEGATRAAITQALKVSRSALYVALKPYAAESPNHRCVMTLARIARARRMLAKGATRAAIAQTLKVSRSALYVALKPYASESPNHRRAMTEAQLALARRMLAEGATKQTIAAALRVALSTVYAALRPYEAAGRGHKPGRPRVMTEAQIALARRMLTEGATKKTIAAAFEVSLSAICIALKPYAAEAPNPRKNVSGRPRAMTEAQIALARRMLAEGATREKIAAAFKVSLSALYATLKPYAAEVPNRRMRRRSHKT